MADTDQDLPIGTEAAPRAELAGHETPDGAHRGRGNGQAKQWAIAGGLLLVLIGVVWWGPASERSPGDSDPDAGPSVSTVSQPVAESSDRVSLEEAEDEDDSDDGAIVAGGSDPPRFDLTRRRQLPELDLETIFSLDPFGPLRLSSGNSAAPSQVKAVYGDRRGKAALVGDDVVRIGQPLPDGRKVIDISHKGVAIGR